MAVLIEQQRDFLTNTLRTSAEHSRIHVALQGATVTDTVTGAADVDGPIETERITAGVRHGFEPVSAAFGE